TNDKGSGLKERSITWREAGINKELQSFKYEITDDMVIVTVKYTLPTDTFSTCTISYTISGDGNIHVKQELITGENLPEIPEIGMLMTLDHTCDHIIWYGKGSNE